MLDLRIDLTKREIARHFQSRIVNPFRRQDAEEAMRRATDVEPVTIKLQQQVIKLTDLQIEGAVDTEQATAKLGENLIRKNRRHVSADQFTARVHHETTFHAVDVFQSCKNLFHKSYQLSFLEIWVRLAFGEVTKQAIDFSFKTQSPLF